MIIFNKELKNPVKTITAFNNEEFKKAFEEIETLRKTHILAGYVRYEAKNVFLGRPVISGMPLLYFEVFEVDGFDDGECSGFLLLRSDSSGTDQHGQVAHLVRHFTGNSTNSRLQKPPP